MTLVPRPSADDIRAAEEKRDAALATVRELPRADQIRYWQEAGSRNVSNLASLDDDLQAVGLSLDTIVTALDHPFAKKFVKKVSEKTANRVKKTLSVPDGK